MEEQSEKSSFSSSSSFTSTGPIPVLDVGENFGKMLGGILAADRKKMEERKHRIGRSSGALRRPDLKGEFPCNACRKIFAHSSSLSRHRNVCRGSPKCDISTEASLLDSSSSSLLETISLESFFMDSKPSSPLPQSPDSNSNSNFNSNFNFNLNFHQHFLHQLQQQQQHQQQHHHASSSPPDECNNNNQQPDLSQIPPDLLISLNTQLMHAHDNDAMMRLSLAHFHAFRLLHYILNTEKPNQFVIGFLCQMILET